MTDQKIEIILQYHLGGKTYPAGWTANQGLGKLVYLAFGHDERTFKEKPVQELCLRGVEWLLS
jgi:type 1 glutamine amidotransferase